MPSAGPLLVVIHTDHAIYAPGQPVHITVTETNRTHRDVTVFEGPSLDGVTVSQSGKEVWRSNLGVQPEFVVGRTLHPGHSITETISWDGQHPEAVPAHPYGGFVVRDEAGAARPVSVRFLNPNLTTTKQALAYLNLRTHPAGGRTTYGYGTL